MSYPKNVKRYITCDKCGGQSTTLIKVSVVKRLGVFNEEHCAECVVLPVYKSESSKEFFVRSTGIVPLD
jgi:hypothetical protein